jgi:hypothetical protein
MKKLVKRLIVPILVLVGLAIIAPQAAQAARWRYYARPHAYVYRPYYYGYAAPPLVRGPRVGVVVPAPGVYVGVGPGVEVLAPGVGVHVGPVYRPYYWGPSYYGWW